jgi:hypothetical protein
MASDNICRVIGKCDRSYVQRLLLVESTSPRLLPCLSAHEAGYKPTHKRTEGRAPVWGFKFTTKAATLQGGSEDFAARLIVNFWNLTD